MGLKWTINLGIKTILDTHMYQNLWLEAMQRFQIKDIEHIPKMYKICQNQQVKYCWCKNDENN